MLTRHHGCHFALALCLTICAAVWGGPSDLAAQEEAATEAGPANADSFKIGFVDVAKVYKEGEPFQELMDKLKQDLADYETDIKSEQDLIQDLEASLSTLQPGDPEYAALKTEAVERADKLALKKTRIKEELANREAEIYLRFYRHLRAKITEFARENGYGLILKVGPRKDFDDKLTRDEVLKGVNARLVYEHGHDITDEIIKRVQQPLAQTDASE